METSEKLATYRKVMGEATALPPLIFEDLARIGIIPNHSPLVVGIALLITAIGVLQSIDMPIAERATFFAELDRELEGVVKTMKGELPAEVRAEAKAMEERIQRHITAQGVKH